MTETIEIRTETLLELTSAAYHYIRDADESNCDGHDQLLDPCCAVCMSKAALVDAARQSEAVNQQIKKWTGATYAFPQTDSQTETEPQGFEWHGKIDHLVEIQQGASTDQYAGEQGRILWVQTLSNNEVTLGVKLNQTGKTVEVKSTRLKLVE